MPRVILQIKKKAVRCKHDHFKMVNIRKCYHDVKITENMPSFKHPFLKVCAKSGILLRTPPPPPRSLSLYRVDWSLC